MNIKLLQGDCYELIKTIPDKSVNLIYTDIPYGVEGSAGGGCFGKDHRDYYDNAEKAAMNSEADESDHKAQALGIDPKILDEFVRIQPKINCYIWCSKRQMAMLYKYFVIEHNCLFEIMCWHKTNPVPAVANRYLSDTEWCLYFREPGVKLYGNYETKNHYFISSVNKKDKKKYNHPTCKPFDFVKNHIINSSVEEDTVFDPFMGSGTTGEVAKSLGRNFIGIELDENYFDTANNRIFEIKDRQISIEDLMKGE